MPQGPGTYGNKRGRPKKKNKRFIEKGGGIYAGTPRPGGRPGGAVSRPGGRPSKPRPQGEKPTLVVDYFTDRPVGSRPIPGNRPPVRPSNGGGRPGKVRPGITTKPGTYTGGRPASRPIPSNKGPLKEAHSIGLPEESKTRAKRGGRRSPTNVGAKGSRRRSAPPSRVEQRRKERRSGFKMRRGVNL